MKLYTGAAPNPFRVEIFLAEKGLEVEREQINIMAGETRVSEFHAINSLEEVPVLALDDGTLITESVAICRYLDGVYPERPLCGSDPQSGAVIEMWNRRIEQQILDPAAQVGRHTISLFADKFEQVPAYAETQRRLLLQRLGWLDEELADGRAFVAGSAFSIADITGMAAFKVCDFTQQSVPAELANVKRWETALRNRPSWAAWPQ